MSDKRDPSPLEPALVNETRAADFLSLSPRAFRELVDRGVIQQVRIPGLRRVAYDTQELRSTARRWKSGTA
jgi:hypothetical protein